MSKCDADVLAVSCSLNMMLHC